MSPEFDPQNLLKLDRELEQLSRHLAGDGASDDVRQEAWLAAVDKGVGPKSTLGGWLARAIRFRASKHHRADKRRHDLHKSAPLHEQLTPEQILERHEVRLQVMKAVNALKEPYQRTITLGFFEGLPPREIARVMGVPVETVRTRTKRAIATLRQSLDRRFGERAAWAAPILMMSSWLSLGGTGATSSITLSQIAEGILVMSGKAKVALTAVLIAVLGLAFYYLPEQLSDNELEDNDQIVSEREEVAPRRNRVKNADENSEASASIAQEKPEAAKPKLETPSQQTEEVGRVELTVINAHTGKVLGDLPVRLLPFAVPNPFFNAEYRRTNKNGLIVLDPWPAGSTLAVTPIGGSARLRVKQGETLEATLKVPQGTKITGVVVDADGVPVSGAKIFASEMHRPIRGAALTESNFEGRFEIPNFAVRLFGTIGAQAKGHLPSPMIMIMESKGDERELRLVLGGTPARLKLEVVDSEGNPVGPARCLIGKQNLEELTLNDGSKATVMSQFDRLTDDNGILRLDSIWPGEIPVQVRAAEFAPFEGQVTLKAGTLTTKRVTLEKGGRVTGTITSHDGLPVVDARVSLGEYGTIAGHYMRVDKKGRFAFDAVTPGSHAVTVESSQLGIKRGRVEVKSGEETVWDVSMEAVASIVGLIVDQQERPVAGLRVRATNLSDGSIRMSKTKSNAGGRFVIENTSASAKFNLTVYGGDGLTKVGGLSNVTPSVELLRIAVSNDAASVASMFGTIVSPDGNAVGGANLAARREEGGVHRVTADGEGRFKFENLIPGTYSIGMNSPDFGYQRSKSFTVKNGDDLDVGEIAFDAAGHLKIVLADDSGLLAGGALSVLAKSTKRVPTIRVKLTSQSTLSQALSPGNYTVSLVGKSVAYRSTNVEVRSGETTLVNFDAKPGNRKMFSFEVEGKILRVVSYKLVDGNGATLYEGNREWMPREPKKLFLNVPTTPSWLEVKDDSGRSASLAIRTGGAEQLKVFMK